MFKDLYKQANEDIKGDRVILEKAFEMAAKPEKKKLPVLKYSYIGTAVAAVVVIGAVFVNSQIFTSKVKIVTPEVENETEVVNELDAAKEETVAVLPDTDGENEVVFICHGDCIEDAQYLEKLVKEKYGVKEVYTYYTGGVIGSHSGPGTLALFFLGTHR